VENIGNIVRMTFSRTCSPDEKRVTGRIYNLGRAGSRFSLFYFLLLFIRLGLLVSPPRQRAEREGARDSERERETRGEEMR